MGYIEVSGRESMFPGSKGASPAAGPKPAAAAAARRARVTVKPNTAIDGLAAQQLLSEAGMPDGAYVLQGSPTDAKTVWLHLCEGGKTHFFQVFINPSAIEEVLVTDEEDIVTPDLGLFVTMMADPQAARRYLPGPLTKNLTPPS